MGRQTSLDDVATRLGALADSMTRLRLTAVEDRPAGAEDFVLESVAETVEELTGWVFEALAEGFAARTALSQHHDATGAVRRLAACQDRVNRLCDRGWTGAIPYETYEALARVARARGGEWPGWLATLRLGLDSCAPPLRDTRAALLESWRQLADPAPAPVPSGGTR